MKPWKEIGRYGTVGLELILSIVLGFLAGRWLDAKLGTTWCSVVGFIIGVYAGFRSLFVAARKMTRDIERAEQREREEHRPPREDP